MKSKVPRLAALAASTSAAASAAAARAFFAFRESGVLYQPVYLGPRDDVDDSECLTSQLKYKAENVED